MSSHHFFEDVWAVARLIPQGKVTTYGAIAKYLGMTKSARMVGWAMNASHQYDNIPAHRVVNRNGLLSGKHHFKTPGLMAELLEQEGVEIHNDQVLDFDNKFWDPETLLLTTK